MADTNPDVDYERSDASPRLLAWVGAGLAAAVLLVLGALIVVYPQSRDDRSGSGPRKPLPPEPRLQVQSNVDLAALRDEADRRISGYGWVDREAGTVRIPVAEAIRLLAERGTPTWPAAPAR